MEKVRLGIAMIKMELRDGTSEKLEIRENKRWKHLKLEFIHQEQALKEGITHLDEIRIRFIVSLSFIKLNWWETMDLHTTYSSWKGLRSDMSQTWEGLHVPPVVLERMNELKW